MAAKWEERAAALPAAGWEVATAAGAADSSESVSGEALPAVPVAAHTEAEETIESAAMSGPVRNKFPAGQAFGRQQDRGLSALRTTSRFPAHIWFRVFASAPKPDCRLH